MATPACLLLSQIIRILHRLFKRIDRLACIAAQRIHGEIPWDKHILAANQIQGDWIILFSFHVSHLTPIICGSGINIPQKVVAFFCISCII